MKRETDDEPNSFPPPDAHIRFETWEQWDAVFKLIYKFNLLYKPIGRDRLRRPKKLSKKRPPLRLVT
jgi:hypothetical protein